VDHFSYFMLRLQRRGGPAPPAGLQGIVQQLSTGEKRTFRDTGELVDLLLSWPDAPGNKLEADAGEGNAVVPRERS
jgi:hypothetical protein